MKSISIFPTFSVVTLAFAGMAVFAGSHQAEAGKGITATNTGTYKVGPIAGGGVSKLPKPPTTGTAKPNSPIGHGHSDCIYHYTPACTPR
jgi:hypothetical protein